jgi:hypothetical protein
VPAFLHHLLGDGTLHLDFHSPKTLMLFGDA